MNQSDLEPVKYVSQTYVWHSMPIAINICRTEKKCVDLFKNSLKLRQDKTFFDVIFTIYGDIN